MEVMGDGVARGRFHGKSWAEAFCTRWRLRPCIYASARTVGSALCIRKGWMDTFILGRACSIHHPNPSLQEMDLSEVFAKGEGSWGEPRCVRHGGSSYVIPRDFFVSRALPLALLGAIC